MTAPATGRRLAQKAAHQPATRRHFGASGENYIKGSGWEKSSLVLIKRGQGRKYSEKSKGK